MMRNIASRCVLDENIKARLQLADECKSVDGGNQGSGVS